MSPEPWHDTVPTAPTPLDAAHAADEVSDYADPEDEPLAFARGMLSTLALTVALAAFVALVLCAR